MPLIQYLYKFLIVIFLVVAFDSPTAQLFLILLMNILMLVYFIAVRPYVLEPRNWQYNNRITIHNYICFSILVILIVVYNTNYNVISYTDRVLIGDIIAGFIIYSATINFIYMLIRAQNWYARHIWKPFVMT